MSERAFPFRKLRARILLAICLWFPSVEAFSKISEMEYSAASSRYWYDDLSVSELALKNILATKSGVMAGAYANVLLDKWHVHFRMSHPSLKEACGRAVMPFFTVLVRVASLLDPKNFPVRPVSTREQSLAELDRNWSDYRGLLRRCEAELNIESQPVLPDRLSEAF